MYAASRYITYRTILRSVRYHVKLQTNRSAKALGFLNVSTWKSRAIPMSRTLKTLFYTYRRDARTLLYKNDFERFNMILRTRDRLSTNNSCRCFEMINNTPKAYERRKRSVVQRYRCKNRKTGGGVFPADTTIVLVRLGLSTARAKNGTRGRRARTRMTAARCVV